MRLFTPSRAYYEKGGVLNLRPWVETVPQCLEIRASAEWTILGGEWTPLPRSEPSTEPPRFLMLDGDWVES